MNKIKNIFSIIKNIKENKPFEKKLASQLLIFLKWQIVSRITNSKIIFDWVNDSKLIIKNGDAGLTGNIYCGLADPDEMTFLLCMLNKSDTFIDVGANQGAYTILASAVVGSRSVAFEPIPDTVERLKEQIAINRISDIVEIVPKGVGDIIGKASFTKNLDTINQVLVDHKDCDVNNVIQIETTSLDDFFKDREIKSAVIKIDVEGYEYKVLAGAMSMLKNKMFVAIIVEINGNSKKFNYEESDIDKLLHNNGYFKIDYNRRTKKIKNEININKASINKIYVRDMEEIDARLSEIRQYKLRISGDISI